MYCNSLQDTLSMCLERYARGEWVKSAKPGGPRFRVTCIEREEEGATANILGSEDPDCYLFHRSPGGGSRWAQRSRATRTGTSLALMSQTRMDAFRLAGRS